MLERRERVGRGEERAAVQRAAMVNPELCRRGRTTRTARVCSVRLCLACRRPRSTPRSESSLRIGSVGRHEERRQLGEGGCDIVDARCAARFDAPAAPSYEHPRGSRRRCSHSRSEARGGIAGGCSRWTVSSIAAVIARGQPDTLVGVTGLCKQLLGGDEDKSRSRQAERRSRLRIPLSPSPTRPTCLDLRSAGRKRRPSSRSAAQRLCARARLTSRVRPPLPLPRSSLATPAQPADPPWCADFSACSEGRTISVTWACREQFKAMQRCMSPQCASPPFVRLILAIERAELIRVPLP